MEKQTKTKRNDPVKVISKMRIQTRKLMLLTIVIMASFGSSIARPAVQRSNAPGLDISPGPSFSMLRDETVKAKWNQEAREFDTAIRELEGILQLNLETKEGNAEATKILERNAKKLQFADSKIASGALKSTRFKKGVEDEAKKRGGNQKFADELKKGSATAKNIPGIEEAVRDAEASIAPAQAVLKRLSDKFEASARKQSAVFINSRYESVQEALQLPEESACGDSTAMGFSAQNACQRLGFNVAIAVCNVILVVIRAYLGFVENLACAATCVGRAAIAWTACHTRAAAQPFPFNVTAASACNLILTRTTGTCLINC